MAVGHGPWLNVVDAAVHVGYPDATSPDPVTRRRALKAFRMWAARRGLVPGRVGRRLRYTVADLDAQIAPQRAALRRVS